MVPEVFKPLKFDCIYILYLHSVIRLYVVCADTARGDKIWLVNILWSIQSDTLVRSVYICSQDKVVYATTFTPGKVIKLSPERETCHILKRLV